MNQHDSTSSESVVSKARLEFLIDGIFAIAMTILVLDLRVPEIADRHSVPELARALAHNAPTFLSYLLSFLVLSLFWYRHNRLYRHFQCISHGMLALNLVQLAAAASFPFCAALLGRTLPNPLAMVVYSGCIAVHFWASTGAWLVARRAGAIAPQLGDREYRHQLKRGLRGCVVIAVIFVYYLVKTLAG